jgi:4-amino-4-deoxy-L-arabinose transferase-like glycosyltransferase
MISNPAQLATMSEMSPNQRNQRLALGALLLLSLILNIVPVWWGLPTMYDKSWALDELSPDHRGLQASERHRGRYPPLHYDLLRTLYKPVRYLNARGVLDLSEVSLRALLQIMGRALSALMATATVLLIYLTARRLLDHPGPLVAAAIVAFSAPFVFFAKTINLEAAYIFWFALSLLFYVRALEHHRLVDYLGFAAAMTFSICTKDQAFALYVLPLLWLVVDLHRHNRVTPGWKGSILTSLFDRRLVWSGLLAITLFVLIHDLLFGFEDFLQHLAFMQGPGARAWREYEMTLAGQISMIWQAAKHTAFAMSWPAFAAAIVGLGVVVFHRSREKTLLTVALFPFSYYLFFIVVAQFHYVRFLLPVAVVASLFSARTLTAPRSVASIKTPVWIGIMVVLLVALRRPVSLDLQMLHDSRYQIESWLAENAGESRTSRFLGTRSQIYPRSGSPPLRLETAAQQPLATLRNLDADLIVVNELEPVNGKQRELLANLHTGALNYLPVFQARYVPWVGSLSYDGVQTNLNAVNPPLTVFERSADWGPADAEIQKNLNAMREGSQDIDWSELANDILTTPILDRRTGLGRDVTAFGLSPDGWTRGTRAAALVVRNDKRVAARMSLALSCGAEPADLPLEVSILTMSTALDVTFEKAGRQVVALPPMPPLSQELVLIFTDREWYSSTGRRRRLGIKIKPLRLRRAVLENVADDTTSQP